MLKKIASALLNHKKTVISVFMLLVIGSLILIPLVRINYDLSDYLPNDAPSTQAIKVMENSFHENIPNLSVLIEDVTIPQAMEYKKQIRAVSGVESVIWLDNAVDVYSPLQMNNPDTIKSWYKDGAALFSVSVNKSSYVETIDALRILIGNKGAMSGDAANQAVTQGTVASEIPKIMMFVVPLVLLILLLSTSSWFEPVLFLISIGIAIIINEGTNFFLGEISFITRSTSAVLQLAVSMDYAVFLLHRFGSLRHEGLPLQEAMSKAMVQSFSAIAASAATTVFGFLVLVLMRFKIGPDMGFVLAKAVLISFLSVVMLLPVLAIFSAKIMDKSHHRSFLPTFSGFGKVVARICIPLAVVSLVIVIPSYLAQKNNTFVYGSSGMLSEGSQIEKDSQKIKGIFGDSVQMVILVPQGQPSSEEALSKALLSVPDVTSVVSYATTVGSVVPEEFLTPDQISAFRSGGYSRIIVFLKTPDEGKGAFEAVERVRAETRKLYPDHYNLLGQSVVNYDLKETIVNDNKTVVIVAAIAVGLVLLLTFRSISIPLILLLAIESATWINLGVPYFTGSSLNYIGYQIISSVQLGATVDYGILFSQRYMEKRKSMGKAASVRAAISDTAASILTPASILTISGVMLGVISSNGVISQLGIILGRGAAISALMVLLVLPGFLMLFDRLIQKTTMRTAFYKEKSL